MTEDFDIENLVHLEQQFYNQGWAEGVSNGRAQGLEEGRDLGIQKGFEMWEEIGFYEGFAQMWNAIYIKQGKQDERPVHHIKHLLELIGQFPLINPSTVDPASDLDVPRLFRQIRSRYKALCATLGVKPSLRAQEDGDGTDAVDITEENPGVNASSGSDGATTHLKPKVNAPKRGKVWKLENDPRPPMESDLNF